MLFSIPGKGLGIIKQSQAIKDTDDTVIPVNYSAEQPVLEGEPGWQVNRSHSHQMFFTEPNRSLHVLV